jgi:hypothetical protein
MGAVAAQGIGDVPYSALVDRPPNAPPAAAIGTQLKSRGFISMFASPVVMRIIVPAFVLGFAWNTAAHSATCFSSPAEVRREAPKAWPKWTYGPNGERCWYAGEKKPVFARTLAEEQQIEELEIGSPSPAQVERWPSSSEPMRLPWALEHRWGSRNMC